MLHLILGLFIIFMIAMYVISQRDKAELKRVQDEANLLGIYESTMDIQERNSKRREKLRNRIAKLNKPIEEEA